MGNGPERAGGECAGAGDDHVSAGDVLSQAGAGASNAERVWEVCCKTYPGEQGQASALQLADLYLQSQDGRPEKAFELLASLVPAKPGAETAWNNRLVDLHSARDVFDRAFQNLSSGGSVRVLAKKLLEPYKQLAEPGRLPRLEAEIDIDWARSCRAQGRGKEPETQKKADQAAHDLFCEAGEAYQQTASGTAQPEEQANLLWLAAYLLPRCSSTTRRSSASCSVFCG